jgi:ribosomal protein L12E/L44/L45/RPP1/RPP2
MAKKKDTVSSSFHDAPDADASGAAPGGAVVTIDVATLEAMIERLLDKKFAQLVEGGMLASAASGAAAPPADQPDEPGADEDDDEDEWQSDPASMTIDDQVPPWEQTPEHVEVPMDTQASTVTIEGVGNLAEDPQEVDALAAESDDGGSTLNIWAKIPVLPGGRASLRGLTDLAPSATKVLVSIDGVSTVKGLRTLAPDVSDAEFTAIIEDGVGRGIVVFT